jgi:hypothetical protein
MGVHGLWSCIFSLHEFLVEITTFSNLPQKTLVITFQKSLTWKFLRSRLFGLKSPLMINLTVFAVAELHALLFITLFDNV